MSTTLYVHLLLSNDAFDKYEEQKNLVDAIQCEAVSTCTSVLVRVSKVFVALFLFIHWLPITCGQF